MPVLDVIQWEETCLKTDSATVRFNFVGICCGQVQQMKMSMFFVFFFAILSTQHGNHLSFVICD